MQRDVVVFVISRSLKERPVPPRFILRVRKGERDTTDCIGLEVFLYVLNRNSGIIPDRL